MLAREGDSGPQPAPLNLSVLLPAILRGPTLYVTVVMSGAVPPATATYAGRINPAKSATRS